MKVLLFTHSQDIDGAGCELLAKVAFKACRVIPTRTFDITNNVRDAIESNLVDEFDRIIVTDLCIKEPLLKEIDDNLKLKNKIIVLDHHKSEIDEGNDKYDFVHIIVEQDAQKECGTSLFYKYLIENHYLERTSILDELVEWTRQYDVYDWVKFNNENARKLHILFEVLGYDKYCELMNLKIDNERNIYFTINEEMIIDAYFNSLSKDILDILKKMIIVFIEIDGILYKIGYVSCPYKYRNDINEYIKKEIKIDIDMLGMIMTDMNTVSYRQVKDVDVSKVASYFGGKGHKTASSNLQENENFKKMLFENNICERSFKGYD